MEGDMSMRKLLRRPSPAMLVASAALFAATAGVSYAAVTTPHDPSFTSHGVAFVPTSAINGVTLPLTGANTSGLANHGMTLSGTHAVAVPTTGIYDLTLAGNCNGGATGSYLKIVEGNGLAGNKVDLALGFEGKPSLAGATTVHLAAGTALNMVAGHAGADVNCGATRGATLVSADV
jgi:hypothetical protein